VSRRAIEPPSSVPSWGKLTRSGAVPSRNRYGASTATEHDTSVGPAKGLRRPVPCPRLCRVLRLITIAVSHYCEKARWAIDRTGQSFREDAHLPLFHAGAVKRAGGRRTVPVLVTPEGSLTESTDILRWADAKLPPERRLFPGDVASEVERWVDELDAEFGVDTRLWAYAQLLPEKPLVVKYGLVGAPRWQARVGALSYPILKRVMAKLLRITPATVARAEQRIDRLLDRADTLLADGRPYLTGDRFTAADLTLAALGAPLVSPPEYHVTLPEPDEMPDAAARRVREWRERASGKHVLAMFRDQRRQRPEAGR
jgi:glutathione S-transferase